MDPRLLNPSAVRGPQLHNKFPRKSQGAADQRRHKMWCPKGFQDVGVSENEFYLDNTLTILDSPIKKVFYPCGFGTCTNVLTQS